MQDLIDILRHQRHDFMNHLQIISGLLQLKKPERALEYITETAEKFKKASIVSNISSAEIAMAILRADLAAQRQGVSLNCNISSNLNKGCRNSWALADSIGELLETACGEVAAAADGPRGVDLNIYDKDGNYVFQVSFPFQSSLDGLSHASKLVFMEAITARINGRVNFSRSGAGETVITISVPAGLPEELQEAEGQG